VSPNPEKISYHQLCLDIISLDSTIESAVIATMQGGIVAAGQKSKVKALLTREESELSIMQSLIRMSTRKALEEKLGNAMYSMTTYQNAKRATVTIYGKESSDRGNGIALGKGILVLLFNKAAEPERIIVTKIIPHLQGVGLMRQGS
jgi:hypothetical protein